MSCNEIFLTDRPEDQAEFRRMILKTVEAITASITDGKAYRGMLPQDLRAFLRLDSILPEHGLGFDALLRCVSENVLPNMLRPFSPDYMPHLHSASLMESIAAELIIAVFNQSMDSWDQSPAATEIEVETIRHLVKLYGFSEEGNGIFTSGGTQSNLMGLLLARDHFCLSQFGLDLRNDGLPVDSRKMRIYCSEIAHFSIENSAHLLGLGSRSVVKVPVDSAQKMDVTALRSLIEQDMAMGKLPFCVVATEGTTDFGSIDPLLPIRNICDQYGLWLHTDAAYGSALIMTERYAERIKGIEQSDSVTIDFHKMFFLPISCSTLLVKKGIAFEPLEFHADYLNRKEDEEDGYINLVDKSIQTTRRFDAFKVWTSFQIRGRDGWNQLVSQCIERAKYLAEQLDADPNFELAVKPEISAVVFRVLPIQENDSIAPDTLNKNIHRQLLHYHGIVIGQTLFRGQVYLKCTLLNPLLTKTHIDSLLELLRQLRYNIAL